MSITEFLNQVFITNPQDYWWGVLLVELLLTIIISRVERISSAVFASIFMFWKEVRYLTDLVLLRGQKYRSWMTAAHHYVYLRAVKASLVNQNDPPEVLLDILKKKIADRDSALILGDPGSGKTTTLQACAVQMARDLLWKRLSVYVLAHLAVFLLIASTLHFYWVLYLFIPVIIILSLILNSLWKPLLPFYLKLGSFAHLNAEEFLRAHINNTLGMEVFDRIADRSVVMLDGTNEINRERYDIFCETWENVDVCVSFLTSRKGERPNLDVTSVLAVEQLDDEGILEFIKTYLGKTQPRSRLRLPWQKTSDENSKFAVDKKFEVLTQKGLIIQTGGIGRNPYWLRMLVESQLDTLNQGLLFLEFAHELIDKEISKKPGERKRTPDWVTVPLEVEMDALGQLALAMSKAEKVGFYGETDWAIAEDIISRVLGNRRETVSDVLYEAQSATLLRVDYKNQIDFTHQLVQEFFTAYALRKEPNWIDALAMLENRKWWTTLSMISGLVIGKDQNNLDAWQRLVQRALGDTSPTRLALAICLLGAINGTNDEFARKLAHAFGLWPTHAQKDAIRDVSAVLPNEFINGAVSIARSKSGFVCRTGLLLLSMEGSVNAIDKVASSVNYGISPLHWIEIVTSLGLWGILPTLERAKIYNVKHYYQVRGVKAAQRLLHIADANTHNLGIHAISALENLLKRFEYAPPAENTLGGELQKYTVEVAEYIFQNQAKYLRSPDEKMRLATVELMSVFSLDSHKLMTEHLLLDAFQKETSETVKEAIVTSLWLIHAFDAIPKLIEMLRTEKGEILKSTVKALEVLGRWDSNHPELVQYKEPVIVALFEKLESVTGEVKGEIVFLLAGWLKETDHRYGPLILKSLRDKSWDVRKHALWRAPSMWEFEYDDLQTLDSQPFKNIYLKLLLDPHPEVRKEAVAKFRLSMDDETSAIFLRKLTWERNIGVQQALIDALVDSKNEKVVPHIIFLLNYHEWFWSIRTFLGKELSEHRVKEFTDALARIGSERALKALIGKSRSRVKVIRYAAVTSLAAIKNQQVAQILLDIISNAEEPIELRATAAKGLNKMGYADALVTQFSESYEEENDLNIKLETLNIINALGAQENVEILRATVLNSSQSLLVRGQALSSMKRNEEYLAFLVANIHSFPDELIIMAIEQLGKYKGDNVFQLLSGYTRAPNGKLRAAAVSALMSLKDPRALPLLHDLLSDEDISVVNRAGLAINSIHPDFFPEYAD